MFVNNALRDSILKSNKQDFIYKYLVKYRNLIHNMKDIFIQKMIDFAKDDDVVDSRLIQALYYEANDVTETEFEILSVYIENMIKKPNAFKDETNSKMSICITMVDKDILKKNPGLFPYKLYEKFLSKIMDLYIPCECPVETVNIFKSIVSLSNIAEHPLDIDFFLAKIKEYGDTIPEDISIDDLIHLYQRVSDILVNKLVAIQTFKDWYYVLYKGAYVKNEIIHTLCDRYIKYFGDSTIIIISGLIADFRSEMLDTSLIRSISDYVLILMNEYDLESNNLSVILKCLMNDVLELINNDIDAYRYTYIQETLKKFWKDEFQNLINEWKDSDHTKSDHLLTPVNEAKLSLFDNGLSIAIEAFKKDSKAINKSEVAIYNAYKKYKNAEEKIDSQITKAVNGMKNILIGDVRSEIIEGKRYTAIGLLKKVLGTVGLFAAAPIKALCFLLVRYALKKNTTISERRKIIMELEAEIEIINEKIDDAKSDGNRKAKYAMMRTRTELQNALTRIRYGLEADEKSTATAKKIINSNPYK